MKKKNRTSLKWKLLRTVLLYWALPFLVLIAVIGIYMADSEENNQLERLTAQLEMSLDTCQERMKGIVADSRKATYDQVLYDRYRDYCQGKISDRGFSNEARNYLDSQYGHKKNCSIAVLMLTDKKTEDKYNCYNFTTGGSYQMIRDFYREDGAFVLSYAQKLDTAVGFVMCGRDRLYVVRNMMDRNFDSWGVLVNRVYLDYCLEPVMKFQEDFHVRAVLNEIPVISTGKDSIWKNIRETDMEKESGFISDRGRVYMYGNAGNDDFDLQLVLNAQAKELFAPLYGYLYVVCAMILCLVPMLLLFLWLSAKYLNRPVGRLMESAEQIQNGNLGYQLETDMGSQEFEYLRESFNQMSERLKYQFDHIYEEELALRDARIMALQSHINPHFMNNTLEIINWEARLSGNEKISRMIEALSTLLDAAIDRRRVPEISLSEEMIHVNAYLYITSQRLGKRLKVEKELPEEIMWIQVPRLILQPIIENAIEHGIVPRGSGKIVIRGQRQENYLYINIINDGEFTEEDERKVKRLLSPDYDTSQESSGNMGIANVNQRLKIIYGESCGLCIHSCGQDQTCSTLTILVQK